MNWFALTCTETVGEFKKLVTTSAVNIALSVVSTVGKISGVVNAFRTGDLKVHTAKDYAVYRFRDWCIKNLDCGRVESYPKFYDMVYHDGDRKYKIRFPKKSGLRQIVNVTSHNGEDITHDILEYLGPSRNFHGIPTSPELLGYKTLRVVYRNGKETVYNSTDIISLDSPSV